MWHSLVQSGIKSTSRSLGAVRGVQWTFSIHSTYLPKSQSENKKFSWSVWIKSKALQTWNSYYHRSYPFTIVGFTLSYAQLCKPACNEYYIMRSMYASDFLRFPMFIWNKSLGHSWVSSQNLLRFKANISPKQMIFSSARCRFILLVLGVLKPNNLRMKCVLFFTYKYFVQKCQFRRSGRFIVLQDPST